MSGKLGHEQLKEYDIMAKNRVREEAWAEVPERLNPGDPDPGRGSPGSIEQQLDMCESPESPRGDEVLHSHGRVPAPKSGDPQALGDLEENWHSDLSEENREGDEMSGDDHSSGMNGGESELESQPHIANGMPGDRTRLEGQGLSVLREVDLDQSLPDRASGTLRQERKP